MRFASVFIAVLAAAVFTCSPAWADREGHANLFVGRTTALESHDWQTEYGFEVSVAEEHWPIAYALDLLSSSGKTNLPDPSGGSVPLTGRTFELDAGIRKIWKKGKVRPYLGGGFQ
jgi:hypothetical protein